MVRQPWEPQKVIHLPARTATALSLRPTKSAPEMEGQHAEEVGESSCKLESAQFGDRYELLSRLRQDQDYDLFVAKKRTLISADTLVTVKRVSKNNEAYDSLRTMLLDEAKTLAHLKHPGIVAFQDVFEDAYASYLVWEHVDGIPLQQPLRSLSDERTRFSFEVAAHLCAELLRALEHVHTSRGSEQAPLNIVHRGVHPKNIFITRTGHLKLAGFELVNRDGRDQAKTKTGALKGRVSYLAPDYIAGEVPDYRLDIYAAGVLLYELVVGGPCFSGRSAYQVMRKIVTKGPDLERLEKERVPDALRSVIARAMAFAPEDRFERAGEMAGLLEKWLVNRGCYLRPWMVAHLFEEHGWLESERVVPVCDEGGAKKARRAQDHPMLRRDTRSVLLEALGPELFEAPKMLGATIEEGREASLVDEA